MQIHTQKAFAFVQGFIPKFFAEEADKVTLSVLSMSVTEFDARAHLAIVRGGKIAGEVWFQHFFCDGTAFNDFANSADDLFLAVSESLHYADYSDYLSNYGY